MKIAFWSNVSGKCYTTANTAAICVMNALENNKKTLVFENHIGLGGLQDALVSPDNDCLVKERNADYNSLGMDLLIRKVRAGMKDTKGITNNIIDLLDGRIVLVPRRADISKEVFDFELNIVISQLLEMFEQYAGNVMIDTSNENNISTKRILENSDVVVVNICQNQNVIDDIFLNHADIAQKAFFVIGNYEPYSRLDSFAISRRYGVDAGRISVVPYNYRFREALCNGKVINFLLQNSNCRKRSDNYYFINELKQTVYKLNDYVSSIVTN